MISYQSLLLSTIVLNDNGAEFFHSLDALHLWKMNGPLHDLL